ncbi:MAG: hypothetical protein K0R14_595 [Burkholderiales bacterium]|nr:hypothetical protein [Burkholderiales bacterium]
MKVINEQNTLGVVIGSCDKNCDLWDIFFDLFFKHWPDIPYPVYLIANHKQFKHERVTTLLAGDDLSWSTTILKALSGFPHSHLLFWLDDVFPIAPIDSAQIDKFYAWGVNNKARYVRLMPHPGKAKVWNPEGVGELERDSEYRVCLFSSIWSVETLKTLLKDGESAREFEVLGSLRSRTMDGFYCTRKWLLKNHLIHGVHKKVWFPSGVRALKKLGYTPDFTKRRVMSRKEALVVQYEVFKSFVYNLLPERMRAPILKKIQKFYKIVGLR